MLIDQTRPVMAKLQYEWAQEANRFLAKLLRWQIIRASWVTYNPQLLLTYDPKD